MTLRCCTTTILSFLTFGLLLTGCAENTVEDQLKTLTGTQYLSFTKHEKSEFVSSSIQEFKTIRQWRRPDFLCDYVLDRTILSRLYENAAEKAQNNLLSLPFSVDATTECMNHGQSLK